MGMFTIACVACLSRYLRVVQRTEFSPTQNPLVLHRISLVSLGLGIIGGISYFSSPSQALGQALWGICTYLRICLPLSLITAVAHRLLVSDRKKNMDLVIFSSLFLQIILGVITTSKEVSMSAALAYIVTVLYFGYRPKIRDILITSFIFLFYILIVVPISQFGRDKTGVDSIQRKWEVFPELVAELFSNSDSLLSLYEIQRQNEKEYMTSSNAYFTSAHSVVERLSLIKAADILITTSTLKGTLGWDFFLKTLDILPNSLTGNTSYHSGNFLGKWTDSVSEDDEATSVSFTPIAEAYVVDHWVSVIVLGGGVFFLFFFINHAFFPLLSENIWAIWSFLLIQHSIAETSLSWMVFYLVRMVPFIWLVHRFLLWTAKPSRRYAPSGRLEQSPF
jgi:hypothetical protein